MVSKLTLNLARKIREKGIRERATSRGILHNSEFIIHPLYFTLYTFPPFPATISPCLMLL